MTGGRPSTLSDVVEQAFPSFGAGAARPADARPGAAADHRRASEDQLLSALRARDLLALAECWQRTAGAAHAVARRLMGPGDDLEALLASVYAELWESPPEGGPLERWTRARTFALGAAALQRAGQGPASPSAALLLPHLPAPRRPATDPVERLIAELPAAAASALVRAHDAGVPAAEQEDRDAPLHLEAALEALAQQTVGAESAPGATPYSEPLGDLVLGLSVNAADAAVQSRLSAEAQLADRMRYLKRGRRRLEGLPPAPELGPRVLLGVVARSQHAAHPSDRAARLAGGVRDDDVVVTVARQPGTSGGSVRAEEQDTGPIAVIAPPEAALDEQLPPWPSEVSWDDPAAAGAKPAPAAPRAESLTPRVRRGVGLLMVGTALGMLAGAVSLLLR